MRLLYTLFMVVVFALVSKSQIPTPSISVSPSVICTGRSVTFTSVTSTVVPSSITWSISPSNVNYLDTSSNTAWIVSFNNVGKYVVSLTWAFGSLGVSTKTIGINVTKSATSSFNASLLNGTGFPNELILTNFSTNSTKNYWVFDTNFAVKDSSVNTSKIYSTPGNYTVSLIAVGSLGCSDSSEYKFTLTATSSMTLPNIFSPNGDGVNERYKPTTEGMATINVKIYNRLGHLLIEWDKVNGFWDGTTLSGVLCDAGDYLVIAEGTGFDGSIYSLKGHITLVR